jgi:hypothetical protein
VRSVYGTMASVFPSVETWRTRSADLMLLARANDVPVDVDRLRRRVTEEPYKTALMASWRVHTAEGVLGHFVADAGMARAIYAKDGARNVNTDDRNPLEFAFARALGKPHDFGVEGMQRMAAKRGWSRPQLAGSGADAVDWPRVHDATAAMRVVGSHAPLAPGHVPADEGQSHRIAAMAAWLRDKMQLAKSEWEAQKQPPRHAIEVMVMADVYAVSGMAAEAEPLIERLRPWAPVEASAIRARLLWATRDNEGCWQAVKQTISANRSDPWANNHLVSGVLPLALELARQRPELRAEVYALLSEPFSMHSVDYLRQEMLLDVALLDDRAERCLDALARFGPHVPWERHFLERRLRCYAAHNHPARAQAQKDLLHFDRDAGVRFGADLPLPPEPTAAAIQP